MKKSYLILFLFFTLFALAQTPGGITNVNMEYWLKANDVSSPLPSDGADVTLWSDRSGNGRDFTNVEANPFYPRFLKSSMNFNSAVDFYFWDTSDGGPSNANNRRRKLMTSDLYSPDATKSYFVVWVSRLDIDNSTTNAVVFGLSATSTSGNTNGNQYGWNTGSDGRLWHRTRGTAYNSSSIGNVYGIGVTVLPNNTANAQQEYLNALPSTTTMGGRILGTGNRPSVIGTSATDTGSENYFFGEIQEIIVMSRDGVGNTLTAAELKQLNSYLAIKYGITLNNASQKDYVLSDGTVVYDRNAAGYTNYIHNVFGIARDDASGLYQRQSMSVENAVLTAYLGELAETNDENTSTLPNLNAVMFGSNGLSGTDGYSQPVGTEFQNYTFQENTNPTTGVITEEHLSNIYNNVLRAKVTGASSIDINVSPSAGEWLLIGPDPTFQPANTRIYKIENGTVEGLTVNDGDYIGFAFFLKSPAGVASGLVMWLDASKRNTITLNAAGEVINWVDQSGFGTSFSKIVANSTAPLYVEIDEQMNFHPAVYFRKIREYLSTRNGPFSVAAPDDYSFFTALNANFGSADRMYFTSYGSTTRNLYPALGVRTLTATEGRARIYDGGGANDVNGTQPLFQNGATTVIGHTMKKNTYFEFYADAFMEYLAESRAGRGSRLNGPGTLGAGGGSDSRNLLGVMGEHIAYEGVLSDEDRDKINSYLGLKYAITIDRDKSSDNLNFDFVLSDGTIVWPAQTNEAYKPYHHNVASVVRDDNSDLHNRQSKSTDVGSIIHMGVGEKLGLEPVLSDLKNNLGALTWGHNNQPVSQFSLVGNPDVCGAMDSRLSGRVWLVDNTNFDDQVILAASGTSFPYNGAGYDVYLLIADSPEKIAANNWDQMVPMTYVDGKHQINYNFKNKRTYFTFGAKQTFNCEGCAFDGIKTLDFVRRGTWPVNGDKGPRNFNLGDNFNVTVAVEDPSNVLRNRYPRASSQKSLRERRRGGAGVITTKISFKDDNGDSSAAAASFELFNIGRHGRVTDDVRVVGYCDGSEIYPTMSYTYNRPERSYYDIDGSGEVSGKPRGVRYSGNGGYTNRRGRVFVEFDGPVEEIRIEYATGGSGTTTATIGIGPMEFYCPAPPPAPNEDGLIFTKQGPTEVQLCEVVDYTFRAINTNCAEKEVVFSDTLPEGMMWVNNSFSAGGIEVEDNNIVGYGTRTLRVTGLAVPGGGSTFTFRASAVFEDDAIAGTYDNRAVLEYDQLGQAVTLISTDRLTGNPATQTIANPSDRPQRVITTLEADTRCFSLDKEIEMTLNIENPNAFTFSDMFLGLDYDPESFELVANSIETSSGLSIGSNVAEDAGSLEFESFVLPAGASWVKFKLKASADLADYEIDTDTSYPADVSFSYELMSEGEDECLDGVFVNANGELEMGYCTVCYYEPVIGDNGDIVSSEGYMALTGLNRTDKNWVNERGNAFIVLESYTKGFVITRLTTQQIAALSPVEGMLVYDTTVNCLKIYNGVSWGCLEQGCVDE